MNKRLDRRSGMERKTGFIYWLVLTLCVIATFLISASIGKYEISVPDILSTIYYHFSDPSKITDLNMETTLLNIRLPRLITVMIVGAGLSIAGSAYQGMFRNPLVSPDILGASSGAAFGACLAMLVGMNNFMVQFIAFLMGLGAVTVASTVTKKMSQDPIISLVLGGIMVSTLCESGISLVKLVADADNELPQITFWLMGGFNTINKDKMVTILLPMLLGFVLLFLSRWQLNVLSFGEGEARSMGIKTSQVRLIVIFASTLITASSVSVCGLVGWVGLVIPHIGRALSGPNFVKLIPTCALVGAIFLMGVDDVARCAFDVELPIGILTSFIGVPFFYIIYRYNRGGNANGNS